MFAIERAIHYYKIVIKLCVEINNENICNDFLC